MTSASTLGIYASGADAEKWGALNLVAWDPDRKTEVFLSKGVRLFVNIPDLGWLMTLTTLVVAAPLFFYGLARWKKNDSLLTFANRAVFLSILLQVMTLAMFLVRANDGRYSSLGPLFPTRPKPLILYCRAITGDMISRLSPHCCGSVRSQTLLPNRRQHHHLQSCFICLPLLTLMIAAGLTGLSVIELGSKGHRRRDHMVSICRLCLHMRVTRGWRQNRAAYFT